VWLAGGRPPLRRDSLGGMDMTDSVIPPKAELLAIAMQRVGFAIWQVQGLEDAAAAYLVVRVRGAKGMGRQKAQKLLAEAQSHTLGWLVTELQKSGVVQESFASRLKEIVEDRNWLVHRGRRETIGMLSKPALYASLSARADKVAEDALALQKELAGEIRRFVIASGASERRLDEEAARLAKAWGIR